MAKSGAAEKVNYRELEESWLISTYEKLPLTIVRGEGVHVFDDDGNKYLDFYGGHAVASVGHCHPEVVKAISDQAGKLIFYSNVVFNDQRAEAGKALCQAAYPNSKGVFFCNSGTEANETALKIARRATGRSRIIATTTGFHGRTIGSLSVTGSEKLRNTFPDNLDKLTEFIPFGDYDQLERAMNKDVAAVILEPVQSTGGVRVATRRYYDQVRELCSGSGAALIFDEVQTALGRTGAPMAGMHWGVEPEIATCAKAIAGGVPCGAVILSEAIKGAPAPGEHGSTFGGGPLAMAALRATVNIITRDKLHERAREMEQEIRDRLGGISCVRAVKGKGLLLGVDLDRDAKPVVEALIKKGVIVGTSGPKDQIRLLPPLTITSENVRELGKALGEVAKGK
ncbi:MAG: aminotransferase class III-fold pyridoxal phosphate-dependent enzyme [Planctomycetes bacterium]|jgi:acetylornithine/N-succinyldiaminopimelate aminotransferase|nr:aminotransferase class III-fold pyridoxal phosphate-dependent enzyme [Planctomycetota bacterium]